MSNTQSISATITGRNSSDIARGRDIALLWRPGPRRWGIAFGPDGDFVHDADLPTAVIWQLTSDRRADAADTLPPGRADPRGWHWDASFADIMTRWGSRLWLLIHRINDRGTRAEIRDYVLEALGVLERTGRARRIEVTVTRAPSAEARTHAAIAIDIYRTEEGRPPIGYDTAWGQVTIR